MTITTWWRSSNWWALVVAPILVVLALSGWVVAWPLLGRPALPDWVGVVVGGVVTVTGPLGLLGIYGDARFLERTGAPWQPDWRRYVLAVVLVASSLVLWWEGGDGTALETVGEAGAGVTEGLVPVGAYYLYRRWRAVGRTGGSGE